MEESALATQQFARTEYGRRQNQLPRLPIGDSSWAVTTHIFGSLVRARRVDPRRSTIVAAGDFL